MSKAAPTCPSSHCRSEYLRSVGRMVLRDDPLVRVERYLAEPEEDEEVVRYIAVHASGTACSITLLDAHNLQQALGGKS